MIKNIKTDLNIFKFNSSENDWIVANSYEEAEKYYLKEINPDVEDLYEEVEVTVLDKNSSDMINIGEEDELRLLTNRYRRGKEVGSVNIWDMLVYDMISYKLYSDEDQPIPFLIATTNL